MDEKKKKRTLRVKKKGLKKDSSREDSSFTPLRKDNKNGNKKEAVNLHPKASQKRIHQILPLVFGVLAFLLFITLLLDLICNPAGSNINDFNSNEHWLGAVGYGFSRYVLLGPFGSGAFLLPFLLLYTALFWKRWTQRGNHVIKLVLLLVLFILFDILIQAVYFACVPKYRFQFDGAFSHLQNYPPLSNPKDLFNSGYQAYTGGFVGGILAYGLAAAPAGLFVYILPIVLITAIILFLQDFSLHAFLEKMKLRRELRSSRVPSMSEQEAEAAGYEAKLNNRMNKLAAKNADDEEDLPPEGAVTPEDSKKKKKDDMAPMPVPKLKSHPNDQLYIPEDLDEIPASPDEAAKDAPQEIPLDIAEPKNANSEAAIDPLFPRLAGGKSAKKAAKGQADPFDLFVCFPNEGKETEKQDEHVPLPPEVPLVTGNVDTTPLAPSGESERQGNSAQNASGESGVFEPPVFRRVDMSLKLQSTDEGDTTASLPPEEKPYVFPPISYLHVSEAMTEDSEEEIHRTMLELAETFQNFRVGVKEINYSCGPTVTRYEVTPAPGVRVKAITGLADDIALSLATSGVRMESNIPGKNAVGVEVPNKHRSTVYLRGLIESEKFTEAKSRLTSCLGVDIAGHPVVFDVAAMPHLLIAGTTGSGKSVCINSIILSLLYKARPDEVKLVLIDPKKVEFSIYRNIPHLLAPIVTTPKDAAGALQAAVEEMERRFEVFAEVEVPDLKRYNAATKDDPDKPFLPQIVIIIDELADLMMTAPTEVEEAICRIAQKARAAGIHLIVGTQRPSVDVVTGLIKSNIPSRIAFTVSSQVDSRTILDTAGAEKLTGKGDMLFSPIGSTHAARVQGTFVSDDEIRRICDFIRASNGLANYDENFISKLKELAARCGLKKGQTAPDASTESEFGDSDAKYTDAVRIAVEEKKISTSLLQRKLQIGYSRAAKLIDRMEAEGIVSPPDGSKPRSILITPEEYLDRFVNVLTPDEPASSETEF
ncbi:MAG: DNA translocase FtsK [Clostridia bacterium]|nr:DNA translocase FtsK [Clostridia bacterium]